MADRRMRRGGSSDGNRKERQEPLQPRLSVLGYPISTPTEEISGPDLGSQLVFRNRPSPDIPVGLPGFDLGVEMRVDRSKPGTLVDNQIPLQWQGKREWTRDPAIGFETLDVMRKRAADAAAIQRLRASMNPLPPEIEEELEEYKQHLAGLEALEKSGNKSLNFEIQRNRYGEAQLDVMRNGATDPAASQGLLEGKREENKQLLSRLAALEKSDDLKLNLGISRNRYVEAQLQDLEQRGSFIRLCIEQLKREHDSIRDALAENWA